MMILEEQFIAKKAAVDADLLSLVNDSSTLCTGQDDILCHIR